MTFTFCPPKQLADLQSQTFPDGKRYYTLEDGTKLPSVTTVLGAMKKEAIMKWRKRVGEDEAPQSCPRVPCYGSGHLQLKSEPPDRLG